MKLCLVHMCLNGMKGFQEEGSMWKMRNLLSAQVKSRGSGKNGKSYKETSKNLVLLLLKAMTVQNAEACECRRELFSSCLTRVQGLTTPLESSAEKRGISNTYMQHVTQLSALVVVVFLTFQDDSYIVYLKQGVSELILTSHCSATRGLLATDHVILNHGQVTWTTPELAPPSPNYHTTPTGGRFSSRQI
ncbi:hypothetical protein TNCV_304051 [Trichonephila clavipes]|nr:hypothetical protein TNCV_304051 [Trichonephila clavipes]